MSDLQPDRPPTEERAPLAADARCARCTALLGAGASYCERCGSATFDPALGRPRLSNGGPGLSPAPPVAVTGRTRAAGRCLVAGGGGIVLSTLLPWFSFLGIASAGVPLLTFLVIGALGALVGYLGVRTLKGRSNRAVMVTLWTVAVVAALFTVGVVGATHEAENSSYGGVTPAVGLYVVVLALAATVVGTVVLQTARRAARRR